MTLTEWLNADPTRTKAGLAARAGISWRTVHRLSRGDSTRGRRQTVDLRIALAIAQATDGAVQPADLLTVSAPADASGTGEQ